MTTCQCQCGCTREATTTDDSGVPVCGECATYMVTDDGEVVCARMTDGFQQCHVCKAPIQWGPILNVSPSLGAPSYRIGRCACPGREWSDEHHGTWGHYSYRESTD
jgi:hypothetical protein